MVGGEDRVCSSWGQRGVGQVGLVQWGEVVCGWAVLEEGDEDLHGFGCWGTWVVEVRDEEGIERGECGVLMEEEWLQCVE